MARPGRAPHPRHAGSTDSARRRRGDRRRVLFCSRQHSECVVSKKNYDRQDQQQAAPAVTDEVASQMAADAEQGSQMQQRSMNIKTSPKNQRAAGDGGENDG